MLAYSLFAFVAVNPLSSGVPRGHLPIGVQQKQPRVLHPGGDTACRPRRLGSIVEDDQMPRGQHAAPSDVPNLLRVPIRQQQRHGAVLFSMFQYGFPKVRQSRPKAGRYDFIQTARDDLISRQLQQLAGAEARVQAMTIVVGNENRLGRVIQDRPQQQLEFARAVLVEPLGVWSLYDGGPRLRLFRLRRSREPKPLRDGGNARRKPPANRLEAENGGDTSSVPPQVDHIWSSGFARSVPLIRRG